MSSYSVYSKFSNPLTNEIYSALDKVKRSTTFLENDWESDWFSFTLPSFLNLEFLIPVSIHMITSQLLKWQVPVLISPLVAYRVARSINECCWSVIFYFTTSDSLQVYFLEYKAHSSVLPFGKVRRSHCRTLQSISVQSKMDTTPKSNALVLRRLSPPALRLISNNFLRAMRRRVARRVVF